MKENKQSTRNTLCTLFNTQKLNVHVIDKQLADVKFMYVTIFFFLQRHAKNSAKVSYMGTQPLDITCTLNPIAKWIHNFHKQQYFNHKQHHIFYKPNLHCIILKILICNKKNLKITFGDTFAHFLFYGQLLASSKNFFKLKYHAQP